MINRLYVFISYALLVASISVGSLCRGEPETVEKNKVLVIVGPSEHPPGTHEVEATACLLKRCLDDAMGARGFETEIFDGWPNDPETRAQARVVVFLGDGFPPFRLPQSEVVFDQLTAMLEEGCSMVCIHYAMSVNDTRSREVPEEVQKFLYKWLGGFGHFLPGNVQPGTQARIMEATIHPTEGGHPVVRGVSPFTLLDEPYYQIKFDPAKTDAPVTSLAMAMLPPESPEEEVVAWSVDRKNGSRSFAIVMPHFFERWRVHDLRKLVLNGIVWSANVEVPLHGVDSQLPDLKTFAPDAVVPE